MKDEIIRTTKSQQLQQNVISINVIKGTPSPFERCDLRHQDNDNNVIRYYLPHLKNIGAICLRMREFWCL